MSWPSSKRCSWMGLHERAYHLHSGTGGLSVLMRCGWLLRRCASERRASTSCSRQSRTCTRFWFATRYNLATRMYPIEWIYS